MIKILLFLSLIIFNLSALEVDTKTLQNIIDNDSEAYLERLLLAKYYEKHNNDLKARSLANEVLEIRPDDRTALAIKTRIENRQKTKGIFRDAGLSQPIVSKDAEKKLDEFYAANDYDSYMKLYKALNSVDIELEDSYHTKVAYIYLWDGDYAKSKKALESVKQANNIDSAKIRADICYYTGDYQCSARLFEKLYNSNYDKDYAIKLMNSYLYLGQTTKAQRLYNFVHRKYPNNKELKGIGKRINTSKNSYLINVRKAYEENKNYETLEPYASALYASGEKMETFDLVHDFNEYTPSSKSLLLEAKYLIWDNKTETALDILKGDNLDNDLEAKLMIGQIYSWEQEFDTAKLYLNEVIEKTQDKEQLYVAKKSVAYVYMWEKDTDLAKKMFTKLQVLKPNDKEVAEALMELNHDYAGLLKIYDKRIGKSSNPQDLKRLGDLYMLNKQPGKALKYLKRYVNENPEDLEATKNLGLLLVDRKEYYQGFGYLEYYAAQKQTPESSTLLAKNYYWHGFSKEALDVLDRLLKNYPTNTEALKLKAKILKISPRFTTSNSGATIKTYFEDLGSKDLQLADSLYFNSHYKASLMYYENYLKSNPDNHDIRYRYAFALENAGEYGKAEGEFSLLFWSKDTDELKYHYAYCMMRNGKLKEAEELLLKLKARSQAQIDPKLNDFVMSWKKAWESQDFQEYSAYYDNSFLNDQIWAYKKQMTFSDVSYISVGVYDPLSKTVDDNRYEVEFYQEYSTNKKADKGYKTLSLKCDDNQTNCKITDESWKRGKYEKARLLTPYIDQSLRDIEYFNKKTPNYNPKNIQIGTQAVVEKKEKPVIQTLHKDIYLAETLKKNFENEDSVFNEIYALTGSTDTLSKSTIASAPRAGNPSLNYLLGKGYFFEDSSGVTFRSADVFYRRNQLSENLDMGLDIGVFDIEDTERTAENRNAAKYFGYRYGVSLFYNHFALRLGINQYEDFYEIVPTIKYQNNYRRHSYVLEYTRQNALFYTYSVTPYEDRIVDDHFIASDFISLANNNDLWASLALDIFSNNDTAVTGQFDWRFYNDTIFTPKFTYHLALEGWYTSHSRTHTDFYSPSFSDSTLIRIDPQYQFSRALGVRGKLGIGHSITDETQPYKYGLWVFGDPLDNFSYSAGCLYGNGVKLSLGDSYNYSECELDLGFSW